MSKAICYISGPMRGKPNDNHEAFNDVAVVLEDLGYEVRNPASNGSITNSYTWQDAMRTDFQWVLESQVICLLPDWEQSEGARKEVGVAQALGLRFMEAKLKQAVGDDADYWVIDVIDTPTIDSVDGIDAEARRMVYGARAQTYGHPRGDFDIIGRIWTGLLQPHLQDGHELDAETVAIMMAGLKLARLAKSPDHRDSQVDTIGYMLCLARIQEDPAEVAAWEVRETPVPDGVTKFDNALSAEAIKGIKNLLKGYGRRAF